MGKYKDRKVARASAPDGKKIAGMVLLICGLFVLVSACVPNFVVGKFFLGLFGLCAYPVALSLTLAGVALLMGLEFKGQSKKSTLIIASIIIAIVLLHAIFSVKLLNNLAFGDYLKACWTRSGGVTVAGVIGGLVCDIIALLLGGVGACVFISVALCILVGLTIDYCIYHKNEEKLISKPAAAPELNFDEGEAELVAPADDFCATRYEPNIDEGDEVSQTPEAPSVDLEEERARNILFGERAEQKQDEPQKKSARDILFGERPQAPNVFNSTNEERRAWLEANPVSNITSSAEPEYPQMPEENLSAAERLFGDRKDNVPSGEIDKNQAMDILGLGHSDEDVFSRRRDRNASVSSLDIDDDSASTNLFGRNSYEPLFNANGDVNFNTDLTRNENGFGRNRNVNVDTGENTFNGRHPRVEQTEIGQTAKPSSLVKAQTKDVKYNPPPITLLKESKDDPSKYAKNYEENKRIIEEKLETFRIPAKVVGVVRGPTVTRYELSMPSGIPVKRILNFDSDLAMALRSKAGVRIEAPIPGKNAVGIETPNEPRSMVSFRELVESKEFQSTSMVLPVAIGKSITGEVVVKSLAKMVHLLVAGSTGSGKSVFLHSLIMSLMFKMSPEQLRFIMIDPKRVEFSRYKGMPHMMLKDVVSDAEKAINSLTWAVKEMERRYKLLEEYKCQKLEVFNQCDAVKNGEQKKLPYIVIVVDELAELMGVAKREVEERIRRISQLGRASGIHLVLATQRPSVEVVTGTIKTNLPSRIAFALSSFIDSKTILDEPGAEKLLGQGDMLFAPQEANTPSRLQGAYISDEEIEKCIDYIKENNECSYDEEVEKEIYSANDEETESAVSSGAQPVDHSDQMDELMPQVLKYFIECGKGSISMVQRRFYVGFNRAARIVDQMEVRGYVTAGDGSKNREPTISMDEFKQIFGDI